MPTPPPPSRPLVSPPECARDPRPLGVFDSGVGGLTVVAALERALPAESLLYLGDTARLPYGTKSARTIQRYSQNNVDFLIGRGVKAVVVACNTASAMALDTISAPVPVFGVLLPGARRAAAISRGHVGVIATESTINSAAYRRELLALRPELQVFSQACPLLVPLVEEGWLDDPVTELVLARYLAPALAAGIDTLVLGCTHYPLLHAAIARVAGERVLLVDSASAIAEEVKAHLAAAPAATVAASPPLADAPVAPPGAAAPAASVRLCFTDGADRYCRIAERWLRRPVAVEWVDV